MPMTALCSSFRMPTIPDRLPLTARVTKVPTLPQAKSLIHPHQRPLTLPLPRKAAVALAMHLLTMTTVVAVSTTLLLITSNDVELSGMKKGALGSFFSALVVQNTIIQN